MNALVNPTLDACVRTTCRGTCTNAVQQDAAGRWFITMGHPGLNSTANNRRGYATKAAAIAACQKCAGAR